MEEEEKVYSTVHQSLIHKAGGYGSEYDSEADKTREKRNEFVSTKKKTKITNKRSLEDEYSKEEWKNQRFHVLSMDAFARHKKFINDYILYYCGTKSDFQRDTSKDKRDIDVIKENHRFLWKEEDNYDETWEKTLAKKYYDKLFKEYCITDLSRYKENKVAMRWRTEKEVEDGKGQFSCGNRKCNEEESLRSWEVNFGYVEHGEKKNALVKLRLCPDCSYKLNYHHKKKEIVKKSKKRDKIVESEHKKKKIENKLSEEDTLDNTVKKSTESSTDTKSDSIEEKSIWSGPAKLPDEKSREEEFEDYFEDMFL